ncbi:MAG TPA: polysaccharide deacetylase family protein [Bacteroidales bacterium]|nr:polysaccharide deacetylase family protein [Bacteroidales bacterium]
MAVAVLTSFDNAKLRYTLDYIFGERLGCGYVLNPVDASSAKIILSYGINQTADISVPDSGFLHPKGVSAQETEVVIDDEKNICLFPVAGSFDFPFDIFAAIFFMLSRYEEYTGLERDQHGRFDLQHSLAFKNNFHQRAVVDEWIIMLRNRLLQHVPESIFKKEEPTFSLTVDVDMLFSYRTKGVLRNLAGWCRDLVKGRFRALIERPSVFLGLRKDPFDTFDVIDKISREFRVQVLFFILASQQRTNFDKNGNLHHQRAVTQIRKMARESVIGLHPSYYCLDDDTKLLREKLSLETTIGISISAARRHFLRMNLPQSYRQLVKAGITNDYTMGFASGHGFRAGTTRPFRFFDLETDKILPLIVHPFCIMDGSLKDYQQMTLEETRIELFSLADYILSINGHFEMLLHNDTLSESGRWKGWTQIITETIRQFQSEKK